MNDCLLKTPLVLVVILLKITLYSCSSSDKTEFRIGISQCSDDMWRRKVNDEMLCEASFYQGTNLIFKTANDDTEQQIADIEFLMTQGVDMLIISPNESTAITPVVEKAMRKGIPVILFDRKTDSQEYTAYIGGDNYQIGCEVGLYAAELLKGAGNVAVIRGWEGSTADKDRHEGFVAVLNNYPNITIAAERRGNFLPEKARDQMKIIADGEDKIDLVFAMNDPMAKGVNEALKDYADNKPFIIGIDALPGEGGGIQNIKNGIQDASFIYPTGGDKVIDLAMKILEGKAFDKENTLYTAVVDKSNVRVIELQTDQIFEHQERLKQMNNMLDKSIVQYSNQKNLLYAVFLILVLIAVLLVISVYAYRNKSRTNKRLKQQNKAIKEQTLILSRQKEQLIKLSQQVEEATNDKLVFFTNISHEFRTPLSLILGPVETLMNSKNLSASEISLLDLIKRNSNRLLALISQIIEFRTYENGKMKVYLSQDDLIKFFKELNIAFSDYAVRKRIDFEFVTSLNSFFTVFDKEKLEKIYFNLLSNAIKYTEKGGSVKVFLEINHESEAYYMELKVFNTGSLIPQDKIASIFDRFFKINPHDAGTGIGLALTKVLVDVLKGSIKVESTEGKGTTFTVVLPKYKAEDINAAHPESYTTGYSESLLDSEQPHETYLTGDIAVENSEKPIVLIIEDNADMRMFMKYTLHDKYTILEAENGVEGIDKAIKFLPDVVVSDIMMPLKDGFEVCKTLKENVTTSHIPIVLLTACSLEEQMLIGFENGADAYISKPFNAEILMIRLTKLIENRRKIKQVFGNNIVTETKKVTVGSLEQTFMNKFKDYVISNITNPDLTVDELADEMNLSRVQLYRKIKSLTGYSPIELIKIIRLKFAVELLNSKTKKMSEVAYESGFSSPSYFTKCFKEFYKESPSDYIKRISQSQ